MLGGREAQARRGCTEHIPVLKLLCNNAGRKRHKLHVAFIDFTQAYDLVPKVVLFSVAVAGVWRGDAVLPYLEQLGNHHNHRSIRNWARLTCFLSVANKCC